jgi:tRNA-splicing ligase RtcB (3'-phosphate/5'-hydroxy nucleic acid ligase)
VTLVVLVLVVLAWPLWLVGIGPEVSREDPAAPAHRSGKAAGYNVPRARGPPPPRGVERCLRPPTARRHPPTPRPRGAGGRPPALSTPRTRLVTVTDHPSGQALPRRICAPGRNSFAEPPSEGHPERQTKEHPVSPTKHDNVLSWASDIDDKTLAQAQRTARLPFIEGHLALMPDAHFGLGATVGSVIPTRGAIIPAAVGVDIGCGMIAAELPITSHSLPDDLTDLHGRIAQAVPSGVGRGHDGHGDLTHYPDGSKYARRTDFTMKQRSRAHSQFGTLGSGNHFVEVCLDERDHVWIVLHSGSRGIGNELARLHIEGAQKLMAQYFIDLEDRDLAYLVEDTDEFDQYIADMLWAQDYAAGNREAMLDAVLDQLWAVLGYPAGVESRINCHHNYTEREHHWGRNVWLTRKGAIRARAGDRGVIPGSMATGTFIVRGLGNPASYESCSHGAGRRMSRGQARRTLDLDGLRQAMAGKVWNEAQAEALLDEDPRSYKDVTEVMASQADLVEIEHTLTQILNYKGT